MALPARRVRTLLAAAVALDAASVLGIAIVALAAGPALSTHAAADAAVGAAGVVLAVVAVVRARATLRSLHPSAAVLSASTALVWSGLALNTVVGLAAVWLVPADVSGLRIAVDLVLVLGGDAISVAYLVLLARARGRASAAVEPTSAAAQSFSPLP
jgi:hypothetical protein